MPPSTEDEATFMASLLADLDDQFWNAVPTPDPSPKKPPPTTPPRVKPAPPLFSAGDNVDLTALLEGAEDWDWEDMNSDFLSPKKSPRKMIPVCARVAWVPCR